MTSSSRATHRSRKPRAIDLFAGCGGLTQGLKDAGFRVIGAVEINQLAAEAYRLNHPEVCLWEEDIRTLSGNRVKTRLKLEKARLELLAGCPPCQGFSSLRTLNGARVVKDARNDLIADFLRFVRVLAPRAIMFENVPGLATKQRFKQFLARLAKLGYKLNWAILDAAEFGVGRAYEERDNLLTILRMYPFFDPLRSDPRFNDLMKKVGL